MRAKSEEDLVRAEVRGIVLCRVIQGDSLRPVGNTAKPSPEPPKGEV